MALTAVSLINRAPAIEFARGPIGATENGVGEADCLATPVDSIVDNSELIVINGVTQTVEPFIAGALAKTIRHSHELEAQSFRVDCSVFAVLLCNGFYQGTNRSDYHYSAKTIDYRRPGITGQHLGLARVMEPLQLAEPFMLRGQGVTLLPKHTLVPISAGNNLYAHKFGEGPIAITDVETAAKHYSTSLLASILRLAFTTQGGTTIMSYEAPDSADETISVTYRYNTGSP